MCIEKFLALAGDIFPRRRRWITQPSVLGALRSIIYGSRYDYHGIEDALSMAFGTSDMRIGGCTSHRKQAHATRVAVTATESNRATIFTNYNKVLHDQETSYRWAEEMNRPQAVKAWEV